ncbi:DUF3846 domain-containing protein [Streptomyces sp. H10-C2]|uniref:DUF3846 domain-containing protein n=1 Tax=unclassified Streptomyces TaxID=2593676 RepID=UPI0024B9B5B5|nr:MULTISPECIES: DUF3846 domain-containing protein [unclassified Streptomyces]MDJ0345872.1 DUF3846 domain-containing protein [Streptomyces sp. PH10-H1]MDJ0374721.1 DUF3846 domain-containing protein [Streptomyces sp. H10-C2]
MTAEHEWHAIVITPTAHVRAIKWDTTSSTHLPALYEAIGCQNVEAVPLTSTLTAWFDGEGMYTQEASLPATMLVRAFRPVHQLYHGTTVITGGTDPVGNTLGLTEEQGKAVLEKWMDAMERLLQI